MADKLPLKDKVATWLEENGYAIEFRAAEALREAGFSVSSDLRVESHAEQALQIDVVADAGVSDEQGYAIVRLMCECKYGKNPWVILSGQGSHRDPLTKLGFFAMSNNARDRIFLANLFPNFLHRLEGEMFNEKAVAGHGLVEAFRSNNDDKVHRALSKTVAACHNHSSKMNKFPKGPTKVWSVCVPLLVTSGTLYRAVHDSESDSIAVDEIDCGQIVSVGDPYPQVAFVCNLKALPAVAHELYRSAASIAQLILDLPDPPEADSKSVD